MFKTRTKTLAITTGAARPFAARQRENGTTKNSGSVEKETVVLGEGFGEPKLVKECHNGY